MSATPRGIDNIKPQAALVFNFIDSDALLATIRKLLKFLGIAPITSRDDCMIAILQSLISMSTDDIVVFEAYAIKLIMENPRVKGKYISKGDMFPDKLHYMIADTPESAVDFIEEIEGCVFHNLESCFSSTISNTWKEKYNLSIGATSEDDSYEEYGDVNLFDWTQPSREQTQTSNSSIPIECQCRNPKRRKLITNEPLPNHLSFTENCDCIHCYIHAAYPLDQLQRCVYCISSARINYYSQLFFNLTNEEYQSIVRGETKINMFVLSRIDTTWRLASDRFRILVNNVEVFSHQSVVLSNNYYIGRFVRAGNNYINICSDLPPYLYIVFNIQRHFSIPHFIEEFQNQPNPPLEESKKQFLQYIQDDDDLDVEDVFQFSLLDPLSKLRMEIPVRSSQCQHLPCFDLNNFMEIYGTKEKMICPVCNKQIYCDDLKKDFYVMNILQNTDEEQDEVNIKPNGDWELIIREEKNDDDDSEGQEEEEEEKNERIPKRRDSLRDSSIEQLEYRFLNTMSSNRQRKRWSNTSIDDYFGRRRTTAQSSSQSSSNIIRLPVVIDPLRQDMLLVPSSDSQEPRMPQIPPPQLLQLQPPSIPQRQQPSQQRPVVPQSPQRQQQSPQRQQRPSSLQQRQQLQLQLEPPSIPQRQRQRQQETDDEIINLVSDSDSSQDIQPSFSNNHTSDYIIDITD